MTTRPPTDPAAVLAALRAAARGAPAPAPSPPRRVAVVATEGDRLAIAYRDGRPAVVIVAGREVPRAQPRPDAPTRYSVTQENVAACVAEALARLGDVAPVRVEVPPAPADDAPDRLAQLRARWLAGSLARALADRAELVEPSPASPARLALASPPCVRCGAPVLGHVPPGEPCCSRACARFAPAPLASRRAPRRPAGAP